MWISDADRLRLNLETAEKTARQLGHVLSKFAPLEKGGCFAWCQQAHVREDDGVKWTDVCTADVTVTARGVKGAAMTMSCGEGS